METGVYFFHIPKTAGSSVRKNLIEHAFASDRICPWWLWDQLITVPRSKLDQWDVFRGHFLSHFEPYLGRPLATFTLLRNPVARTISHYNHVRRHTDHPFHEHALRMSLRDFCVDPMTRWMVENYQAAYLAKAPCDPAAVAQDLTPERLARFELQVKLESPDHVENPATLLKRAKERLITFTAVGLTEDYANSLLRISQCLNCRAPQSLEPQNVNPERSATAELDRSTLTVIRDLTEVDELLYQFVSGQLKAKLGSSQRIVLSSVDRSAETILQQSSQS